MYNDPNTRQQYLGTCHDDVRLKGTHFKHRSTEYEELKVLSIWINKQDDAMGQKQLKKDWESTEIKKDCGSHFHIWPAMGIKPQTLGSLACRPSRSATIFNKNEKMEKMEKMENL